MSYFKTFAKKTLCLIALVLSSFSYASSNSIENLVIETEPVPLTTEKKLMSARHCMLAFILCTEPESLFHDQNGRCGCLAEKDYWPIEKCTEDAPAWCAADKTYSDLIDFKTNNKSGCGCFATSR